jgi:exodeoxyribonuclease-5
MVGEEMANDLLAFGKPILVLGDPGQLPPIKGEGAFTNAAPDVMLHEIHRQAGESAIIRLATMARRGEEIAIGAHDEFVWKMRRFDVTPAQMLNGGQVICARNATRRMLNTAMKAAAGFGGAYPSGAGEKIICLKNRADLGIVNGQFLSLNDIRAEDRLSFTAAVTTEDGQQVAGRPRFYTGHYDDHVAFDPERARRDWLEMKGLVETSWGYAITCHKAQGSQFPTAVVLDEGFGSSPADRNRWLYTAITRAEWGLVILS